MEYHILNITILFCIRSVILMGTIEGIGIIATEVTSQAELNKK